MNRHIAKVLSGVVAAAGLAVAGPAAFAAGAAAPAADLSKLSPLKVYGNDGNVAPNVLYLGTPANWAFVVPQNGRGTMDAGSVKAEPTRIGDQNGVKVTWTGGIGQVYSQSKMANDQLDYIDANAALVFEAVLHKAPEDQVTMRVDCRYPCMGVVDVTDYLKKLPLEQPATVKIPLACFEKTGTKFAVVNTPWLIFTTKPLALSVANVRYVPGAAKDPDLAVRCGA